jgi:hypothetical protein
MNDVVIVRQCRFDGADRGLDSSPPQRTYRFDLLGHVAAHDVERAWVGNEYDPHRLANAPHPALAPATVTARLSSHERTVDGSQQLIAMLQGKTVLKVTLRFSLHPHQEVSVLQKRQRCAHGGIGIPGRE